MANHPTGKSPGLTRFLMRLPCALALAALVGACATDPGSVQVGNPNVPPTNYREEIVAYLKAYLNNLTGIRDAAISEPKLQSLQAGYGGQGIAYGPLKVERYVVCVRYNAKNSVGRYEGTRDRIVLFLAGRLDTMTLARGEQCKDVTWLPFPELEKIRR